MDLKRKKEKTAERCIFAAVFLVLLFLAYCTPLAGDDYIYAFNDNSYVKPVRIIDIVRNIRIQRVTTSARFISHFFVEFFIMDGKWIFNIMNSAVNTAGLWILFRLAEGKNGEKKIFLLLSAIFMAWIFMPVFGEVYLWLDGACNYSWAMVLLLFFIFPFYKEYVSEEFRFPLKGKILWLILCPVFGAYSENGSAAGLIAAFLISCLMLIREKRHKRRLKGYLAAGFFLCCAGYSFLISSPVIMDKGEISGGAVSGILEKLVALVRSVTEKIALPVIFGGAAAVILFTVITVKMLKEKKGLKALLGVICLAWAGAVLFFAVRAIRQVPNSGNAAKAALTSVGTAKALLLAAISEPVINLISVCAVFLIVFLSAVYCRSDTKKIICAAVFAVAGFASAAVFVLAIYQPARSSCYFVILLIAGILILLPELWEHAGKKLNTGGIILAVIFAVFFAVGTADVIHVKKQDNAIMDQINAARSAGESAIALKPYEFFTKYSALYGIDNITEEYCWLNHYMGKYYGFDELVGVK